MFTCSRFFHKKTTPNVANEIRHGQMQIRDIYFISFVRSPIFSLAHSVLHFAECVLLFSFSLH